ncbi:MAG: hypothetical protein V1820_00585 [archaeon]
MADAELLRVYFAHPKPLYPQVIPGIEEDLLAEINRLLPEALGVEKIEIENPSEPQHQKIVGALFSRKRDGMAYFTTSLVPSCDATIYCGYPEMEGDPAGGYIGAGVAKEVQRAFELNQPVFELRYRVAGNDRLDGYAELVRVTELDPSRRFSSDTGQEIRLTSARNSHYREKYKSIQQSSDLSAARKR